MKKLSLSYVHYQNIFLREMGVEDHDPFAITQGVDLYAMADTTINLEWMNTTLNNDVRELATSIVSFMNGKSKKRHSGVRNYIEPIRNKHIKIPRGIKFNDVVVRLELHDGDLYIINNQNMVFGDNAARVAHDIIEAIIGDDDIIWMHSKRFIDVYHEFYLWRKNKIIMNASGEVYPHIAPPPKGNNKLTFSNSLSTRKKDIFNYVEEEKYDNFLSKHKYTVGNVTKVDYYTNKEQSVDFERPSWFNMVGSNKSESFDVRKSNKGDKVIRTPMTVLIEQAKGEKKRRTRRGMDIFSKKLNKVYTIDGNDYDVYGKSLNGQLPFWTQYYTYGNKRYAVANNSIVALSSSNHVIAPDGEVTDIKIKLVDYTSGRSVLLMANRNGELKLNVTRLGKNPIIATVPFGRVTGVLLIGDKYLGKGVCGRLEDLYKNTPEEFHTLTVPKEINLAISIVDEILTSYKTLKIKRPIIYVPDSITEREGKLYVKDALYAECTLEEYNSLFSTLNDIKIEDYITLTLAMTCATYNGIKLSYKVVSIKYATFLDTGEYAFDIPSYTPTSVVKLTTALRARYKKFSMSIPTYYGGLIAITNDTIQALQNSSTYADERQAISRKLCRNHYIMGTKPDDVFDRYLQENENLFSTIITREYSDKLEMDNLLSFDEDYDVSFSGAMDDVEGIEVDGEGISLNGKETTFIDVLKRHEESGYTNEYFYLEGGINCLPLQSDIVKFVDLGNINFVRYIPTYNMCSLDANGIFWRCNNRLIVKINYNGKPRFYMRYQGEIAEPLRTLKDSLANYEIPVGGTLSISKDDAYLVDIYTGKKFAYTGTYLTHDFVAKKHCAPKNSKKALLYFSKLRKDLVPIPSKCDSSYPVYVLGEIKTDCLTMFDG